MNRVVMGVLGLGLAAALYAILAGNGDFPGNPLAEAEALEYPSFAVGDAQGRGWVVDKSLTRLSCFDGQGHLVRRIQGGSRDLGSLYSVGELALDESGALYLINVVQARTGFLTVREDILRVDGATGTVSVVFSRNYGPEELDTNNVTRGRLTGLRVREGRLTFFELARNGAVQYSISTVTWIQQRDMVLPGMNAALWLASIVEEVPGKVLYVTKEGKAYRKHRDGPAEEIGLPGLANPWWIQGDGRGGVLVSDLSRGEIVSVPAAGTGATVLGRDRYREASGGDDFPYTYYQFQVHPDGTLGAVNDRAVVLVDRDGDVKLVLSSLAVPLTLQVLRALVWLGLVSGAVLTGLVILWFARRPARQRQTRFRPLRAVPGLVVTGLYVAMCVWFGFDFVTIQERKDFEQIAQAIQLISQGLDTDRLDRIRGPADFMEEDYRVVREHLHRAVNNNQDEWNRNLYFALHSIRNNKLHTMMYLNDGVGPLHPFAYLDDPTNAYWRSMDEGIVTGTARDAWGSWAFGVGPVRDQRGKVVALLEIGRDRESFEHETRSALGTGVVLSIAMGVIILGFFLLVPGPRRREP